MLELIDRRRGATSCKFLIKYFIFIKIERLEVACTETRFAFAHLWQVHLHATRLQRRGSMT